MGNLHKYFSPIIQMVLVSALCPALLFLSVSDLKRVWEMLSQTLLGTVSVRFGGLRSYLPIAENNIFYSR